MNIISCGENSFYDEFVRNSPKYITDEFISTSKLPTIVMIGGESTGKSATIENITMLSIFPTDKSVCTRCPVRIVMVPSMVSHTEIEITWRGEKSHVNEYDAREYISRIFTDIESYSKDELLIEIYGNYSCRFEFVDLPGIVNYPQSAHEFTTALADDYIKNSDNFIMCVVNATIPRLTSYYAINRIINFNANMRTVLVLTKYDKLVLVDFDEYLFNRLDMSSDEFISHKYIGCCGVHNRDSARTSTLINHVQNEQALINYFHENNYHNVEKLGVEYLMNFVLHHYDNHIKQHWIPKVIKSIQLRKNTIKREISELGCTNITCSVKDKLNETIKTYIDCGIQNKFSAFISMNIKDSEIPTMEIIHNMRNEIAINFDKIHKNTNEYFNQSHCSNFKTSYNQSPYKLKRFYKIWQKLEETTFEIYDNFVVSEFQELLPCFKYNYYSSNNYSIKRVFEKLITELQQKVYKCFTDTYIDDVEMYVEDGNTCMVRANLTSEIEELDAFVEWLRSK
uniref:Dynamin family protein n=1 Tax=Megaviridae environmental sample TaxID=1737588 RepID=A0A5J6VIX1_9VIRU|nr:MAG: dynamin family protein [Megaviridae environmental sample]